MINLNKDQNTGQILHSYVPTEIKKTNQGKEVESVVGTNVTAIQAA